MIRAEVTAPLLTVGSVTDLAVQLHNPGPGTCTSIVFTVVLPRQLLLLRGNHRVEAGRLGAGESVSRTLRVRPGAVGRWPVTSANFSYRDHNGIAHRVTDFAAELTVAPAAAAEADAALEVGLPAGRLVHGAWTQLRGRVHNSGGSAARDVLVAVTGPIDIDGRSVRQELGSLPAGGVAEFGLYVRAGQVGSQVPMHFDVTFVDQHERTRHERCTVAVQVDGAPTEAAPAAHAVTILYLSANPTQSTRLRVDAELREIQQALRLGRFRDQFDLQQHTAVRARDISQALLDVSPRIVHFSGHGAADGGLVVENEAGRLASVSVDGLADWFALMSHVVDCVIVNACHSDALARALSQHIDHVIGMKQNVGDQAAILFSIGFYQALGANRSIEDAFGFGCAQVRAKLSEGQHENPVLYQRKS